MWSQQGVRQGDPLATLLFAIGLQTALKALQQRANDQQWISKIMAYHDDVELMTPVHEIKDVLEAAKEEFALIGLKVQTKKSRIVDLNYDDRTADEQEVIKSVNVPIDNKCGVVLGCPIGKTSQDETIFMKTKLQDQLQVLDVLSDSRVSIHQATTIMRVSTVHKLDHWLRNVQPSVMQPIAKQFDDKVMACFLTKMNLNQQINATRRRPHTSNIETLIQKSLSLGGDGITATETTCDTCWVAGISAALAVPTTINAFRDYEKHETRPTMTHKTLDIALKNVHKLCHLPMTELTSQARQIALHSTIRSHLPRPNTRYERALALRMIPVTAKQLFALMSGANRYAGSKSANMLSSNIRQRQLLAVKQHQRILESHSNISNIDRARLKAIRAKGATRLLTRNGHQTNMRLNDCTYQTFFCMRHGIPQNIEFNNTCPACHKDISATPFHELGCVKGKGAEVTTRHNTIRNTIANTLNKIGGIARIETTPFANTQMRPDIEWTIGDRRICFDVSVTHPLGKSIVQKAARYQLAAAAKREEKKNVTYVTLCQQIGAEFIPLVIETFGGLGKQFTLFISDLQNVAKTNLTLVDGAALINEMLDQIAFHVISFNGMIMKSASSKKNTHQSLIQYSM